MTTQEPKNETTQECLAHINLDCIRLQCRDDFPANRCGYLAQLCASTATREVREDAYKMACRGLEGTEEASALRNDLDRIAKANN